MAIWGRMGKQTAVGQFDLQSRCLLGLTEENRETREVVQNLKNQSKSVFEKSLK